MLEAALVGAGCVKTWDFFLDLLENDDQRPSHAVQQRVLEVDLSGAAAVMAPPRVHV